MAALHRQVWDGVIALFDQFVETADEENISREEYADLLDGGLAALSSALIPPGLDAVTVGDFDQNSLDNIPVLFVMGANEGIMPRRAKEKGIFTDADRLRLREAGINCRVITGMAKSEQGSDREYHAWNIICIDGKWYNCDVTWDVQNENHELFLKNDTDFKDHRRDEKFTTDDFLSSYKISEESYPLP